MKELRSTGLSPDFLICRTATPLEEVPDVSNIYHVPLVLRDQHAGESILKILELPGGEEHLERWEVVVGRGREA